MTENIPLLLKAIEQQPISRPPVWLMRQAGRYLTEYLAIKEKFSFLEMCKTPEIAVEVTLQPIHILNVDAAILFADILLPLEGMGIEIDFNPGPVIKNPITTSSDINALTISDPLKHTGYVLEAMAMLKNELRQLQGERKATIGFAGSPWTLACYITAQGPYKHFIGTQVFAKQNRTAFHKLLAKLTLTIKEYCLAQIESGAEVIQIFDSWGGVLNEEDFREFSLPYIQDICGTLSCKAPTILYVNGFSHALNVLRDAGAQAISVDSKTSLEVASELFPNIAIQGNLDPTTLFEEKLTVREKTREMLKSCSRQTGYIVNLGHGILPQTPRENVIEFVKTVLES